jgi:hydrogenase-4 membrane subunit HyfE
MRRFLNILGGVVLVLMVLLRSWFQAVFDERANPNSDGHHARGLRRVIVPAGLVLIAFVVLSVWTLLDAGYGVLAIVLVLHLALLFEVARRRQD